MKTFLYNLLTVISTVVLLFTVSMLLDWQFIQAHTVRKVVVYLVMLVVLYIGFNVVVLINKQQNNE